MSNPVNRKRPRSETSNALSVPVFHTLENRQAFLDAYDKYQVVHLSKLPLDKRSGSLTWKDFGKLFQSLEKDDQDSWCVENAAGAISVTPAEFLKATCNGYASFLLQKNKEATLERLPLSDLKMKWTYGPCVWFFFGINTSGQDLQGRKEHTDSVSHDGTWHYQLSGCKRWSLRPTKELLGRWNNDTEPTSLSIDCQEGDVLVVNTRLWWHCTTIPSQTTPSVSYARDFFMTDAKQQEEQPMSNIDGLYAANDIEEGTVLFTQDDMPDCELHRSSTDPNCEIVELEDGTGAVVSIRDIRTGEFFCVAESEDEANDSDEES